MLATLLWGLALGMRLIGAAPAEDDESKHRHPLGDAVFIADADTVSSLLESQDIVVAGLGPIAPNHKDHLGRTPMMLCGIDPQQTRDRVDQACGRIAKMLISAGAEVNHLDKSGWTPTAYAASLGWSHMIDILALKGADINAVDNTNGHSPLMKAAAHGNVEAVRSLIKAGAKLDQQSWHESGAWGALSLAARNSSPKLRQQKEHEVAVLPTGDTKASAQPIFSLPADTGTKKDRWIQVIDILLEAGSEVDLRDSAGRTPLMIACSVDSYEAVKALLDGGADCRAKDDAGYTPAFYSHGIQVRQLVQNAVLDAVTKAHEAWLAETDDAHVQVHGP